MFGIYQILDTILKIITEKSTPGDKIFLHSAGKVIRLSKNAKKSLDIKIRIYGSFHYLKESRDVI